MDPLERASFTSLTPTRTNPSVSEPRMSRTTMEFLFELDSPAGPPSSEIDLSSMPEVVSAVKSAEASPPRAEPAAAESAHEPALDDSAGDDEAVGDDEPPPAAVTGSEELPPLPLAHTLPRISLRPPAAAKTVEEQHEQRKRRIITRVVTCRDAFRVMGFLDLRDSDRKEVARLFMGLDQALDLKGASVAKEPASALANANKDELDRIERLISPIEDRLLALDELVPSDVFNARTTAGKMTAKALARYGRLLVSRRIQAGQRRDRFEWIATLLLTRRRSDGLRDLVGEERATQALELLIGGLPFKAKEQEIEEAVAYLSDALDRLGTFKTQDEFFNSELFLDVHGYKVSMREQLLNADFVYLSVAFNVKLQALVEQWVQSVERLHRANQLTQEGKPREQIERRLREQEASVADIFGVKNRPPPAAIAPRAEPRRKEDAKAAKPKAEKKKPKRGFSIDGRLVRVLAVLLVIGGSAAYVALETGAVNIGAPTGLTEAELSQLSSIIARGDVAGSGRDALFQGQVRAAQWNRLNAEQRRAEAEKIAKGLAQFQVRNAHIAINRTIVIEIRDGLVARVAVDAKR